MLSRRTLGLAVALAYQGADVLLQHTDSPAAVKFAEDRKIFAVGQASDMRAFGKTAILTSLVNNRCVGRGKGACGSGTPEDPGRVVPPLHWAAQ